MLVSSVNPTTVFRKIYLLKRGWNPVSWLLILSKVTSFLKISLKFLKSFRRYEEFLFNISYFHQFSSIFWIFRHFPVTKKLMTSACNRDQIDLLLSEKTTLQKSSLIRVKEINSFLKEINRLLSKGMSNICLKITIEKNWHTQNFDFISSNVRLLVSSWRAPTHANINEFSNIFLQY